MSLTTEWRRHSFKFYLHKDVCNHIEPMPLFIHGLDGPEGWFFVRTSSSIARACHQLMLLLGESE